MENFQVRAIASHRNRHEAQIRQAAKEIREYADYILRDLDSGRTSSSYARAVLTDARTIVTRFAMLEAMADVTGIVAAPEG